MTIVDRINSRENIMPNPFVIPAPLVIPAKAGIQRGKLQKETQWLS